MVSGVLHRSKEAIEAIVVSRQHQVLAPFFAGKVVVIDPGHGGPDPGSIAQSGLLEKDVVLDVGIRLRGLLEDAGVKVVMTRDDDVDLSGLTSGSLRERWRAAHRKRLEIVEASGAHVVISIHANSVPSPRWSGAQTFYNPSGAPENRLLAELIQRELRHITGGTDRIASDKVEHFLLNNTKLPAVLVEVGFLSNPDEARLLADPSYRQQLAWAIFVGLGHYFAEQELPAGTDQPVGAPAGVFTPKQLGVR